MNLTHSQGNLQAALKLARNLFCGASVLSLDLLPQSLKGNTVAGNLPLKGAVIPRQASCPCLSQLQPALILHQVHDFKTGSLLPAYSMCTPRRAEARHSHPRDFPDAPNFGRIAMQRKLRIPCILPHSHVICRQLCNANCARQAHLLINSSRKVKTADG